VKIFDAETKDAVSISVLTLMHNDYKYIEGYSRGLSKLCDNSNMHVELLVYFWDCEPEFIRLAKDVIGQNKSISLKYHTGINLGFSAGNNLLCEASSGEILFFLNPDTEVISFDANELIRNRGQKAIFEPVQVLQEVDNERGKSDEHYLSNDLWFYAQITSNAAKQTYVDGAALIISKEYFRQLGRFDEDLFIFQEDMDLGLRNLLSGGWFVRLNSKVRHFSGGTVKGGAVNASRKRHETSGFRRYHSELNKIRIAKKYLNSRWYLVWVFSWVVLNILISMVLFIFGQFSSSLVAWKSGYTAFTSKKANSILQSDLPKMNRFVASRLSKIPSQIFVFLAVGIPRMR
jgi:GT2 family glycosyltransferase